MNIVDFLKNNKKIIFLFLVLVFTILSIYQYVFSENNISPTARGNNDEFISEYITGKNFTLKGFFRLFFLLDFSTDFRKNSQPIFYTHENSSLPSVIQGLLIKIGLDIFQSRIVFTLISLFGIILLYLFVSEIASISAALFTCLLLAVNFSGFLSLVDHNHYSLGFPLLFGYLLVRYGQSTKKYFIVPIIFLIGSLMSYMLLAFMLIIEFLFFIFEKNKKIFFGAVLSAAGGIFIHIIQNMLALTPKVALQDIWLTIQNRFFGAIPRIELIDFYQKHNLVLWGSYAPAVLAPIKSFLYSAFFPFYLFKTSLLIGFVAAVIFYIIRQGNIYKSRKIIGLLFFATVIWQLVVLQTLGAHPLVFHSFLVIFLGVILGDLFYILTKDLSFDKKILKVFFKKILFKIVILSAIILLVFKYFTWAEGKRTKENSYNLLGFLDSYKGKTFFSNISATMIAFNTQNWVVGFCLPEGLLNLDASRCYSKFVDLGDKELIPDYILLSSRSFAFDCSGDCFTKLKENLASKYSLVEEINNGENIIFQVKK